MVVDEKCRTPSDSFPGYSAVIDPWGAPLCEAGEAPFGAFVEIEPKQAEKIRRHIQAHREHLELIRYLRNGQKEEAVAALTLHLIKSKEAAIKTLIEKALPVV